MIVVSSLLHLKMAVARHRPSHVLTLLSPGLEDEPAFDAVPEQHLRLTFHDIDEPRAGLIAPDRETVEAILKFGQGWTHASPLLVHCWAGISRSSAAAYMLACARNPGSEDTIADALRARAPFATPNRLMVAHADALLGRDGRMIRAVARIGRGAEAAAGSVYELPLAYPSFER